MRTLSATPDGIVKRAERPAEGMGGLAKGLAIIEAFEGAGGRVTIADAARLTGVTRATARRCLLTLVDLGYVDYDGKFYRPLPRVMRLGSAFLQTTPLREPALPILTAARDVLGESVSLAVLEGCTAVFIARAEALRIVSTGVGVGGRLPAHCSATGRVLLARYTDEHIRTLLASTSLERRSPKTVTDIDKLVTIVAHARRDGYAVSDEELELGMRSLAVAVHDRGGTVAAAMSVSVSSARVTADAMIREMLPILQRHARMLDKTL